MLHVHVTMYYKNMTERTSYIKLLTLQHTLNRMQAACILHFILTISVKEDTETYARA